MPNPLNDIHLLRQPQQFHNRSKPVQKQSKDELEKTCKEFESVFVSYMLKQMRQTIPEDGLISRGQGEKIYTGMLDNEIAKTVSHSRGMGLAKVMYEQMAAIQDNEPRKK